MASETAPMNGDDKLKAHAISAIRAIAEAAIAAISEQNQPTTAKAPRITDKDFARP